MSSKERGYFNMDNCTNKYMEGTKGKGHVDIYSGDIQGLTSHVILKVLKIATGRCFSICSPPPKILQSHSKAKFSSFSLHRTRCKWLRPVSPDTTQRAFSAKRASRSANKKKKHFQEQMSSQFVSPVSQHTHTHIYIL